MNDRVDFAAPSWPKFYGLVPLPPVPYSSITAPFRIFGMKKPENVTEQMWIGRGIPREDVRWIATLLSRLSPKQIRDAFRAAHYPPEEVEAFSRVLESRIAQLAEL